MTVQQQQQQLIMETDDLSQEEIALLKLMGRSGERVSLRELSRRSPFGMVETQAIVSYLVRNGFLSKPEESAIYLQTTETGKEIISRSE